MQVTFDIGTEHLAKLVRYAEQHRITMDEAICQIVSALDTTLSSAERGVRIKEGLERSGYKPEGKKPNKALHRRIRDLAAFGVPKESIALDTGCGIATVYRVLKDNTPA